MIQLTLLDGLLLCVAALVLAWGFERYRTQFVKSDLLLAIAFAGGLLLFAVTPRVYDYIGLVLDVQKRFVVVSLLANLALVLAILYLATGLRTARRTMTRLTRSLSVDQAPSVDGESEFVQILIPAYNEAGTIGKVLESLPATLAGYDVRPLVVSDGSVDGTARIARSEGASVIEHPVNQGQGGALKTGFEVAERNDAAIVVTMDADGQHPAEELDRLVGPIVEGSADFVVGSRYEGADESGNGVVRRSGIRAFTILINVLTKSEITDCTNGFRAIRGSDLEELTLTEERFSAPELLIEARKKGLRVTEIPVRVEERQEGDTKKPQLGYAIGLTRTILATWIR